MAGPFGRILAQAIVTGAQIFTKAFAQAYQQAAQNAKSGGGAAAAQSAKRAIRKRMAEDEALKVLNFESKPKTAQEIIERYDQYFNANAPENGGSFYIQSKIYNARETLESSMKKPEEAQQESTEK